MPRLLIAGFGYVGRATGELFTAKGWEVEGWTRTPVSIPGIAMRAVDIRVATGIPCDDDFDVVIQCASTSGGDAGAYEQIYLHGAQNLRAAFPKAALIFASSTSVYAQKDGEWVDEKSDAAPTADTARILREAEDFVLSNGGLVARLAGIHGPTRSFILRSFLDGTATLDGDRFVNQVHRDDIASAFYLLATNQRVEAGVNLFNVVDDEPILRSACYKWLAQKLARPIPAFTGRDVPRKRGRSNKRVSNSRLRAAGWTPQFATFAEAMERSILAAMEGPPR